MAAGGIFVYLFIDGCVWGGGVFFGGRKRGECWGRDYSLSSHDGGRVGAFQVIIVFSGA